MELKEALSVFLPAGILDYFEISKLESSDTEHHFYLVEKNEVPEEYSSAKYHSKGFFEEIKVQDFPIRNKAVYLHIKRRKWVNPKTSEVVYRKWSMVAQGTRVTQSFALFLKKYA